MRVKKITKLTKKNEYSAIAEVEANTMKEREKREKSSTTTTTNGKKRIVTKAETNDTLTNEK